MARGAKRKYGTQLDNPLKKCSTQMMFRELNSREKIKCEQNEDYYILKIPKKEVDIFE